MKPYFEKMPEFGKAISQGQVLSTEENVEKIKDVEEGIEAEVEKVKNVGFPEEKINARGQMTVWQRLKYLVDPGTWCPLHTLYNPDDNAEGSTNVFDGLGKISGKWAVIIGFDNKLLAGAWVPGQYENILRVTNLSKRLLSKPMITAHLPDIFPRPSKTFVVPSALSSGLYSVCRGHQVPGSTRYWSLCQIVICPLALIFSSGKPTFFTFSTSSSIPASTSLSFFTFSSVLTILPLLSSRPNGFIFSK